MSDNELKMYHFKQDSYSYEWHVMARSHDDALKFVRKFLTEHNKYGLAGLEEGDYKILEYKEGEVVETYEG